MSYSLKKKCDILCEAIYQCPEEVYDADLDNKAHCLRRMAELIPKVVDSDLKDDEGDCILDSIYGLCEDKYDDLYFELEDKLKKRYSNPSLSVNVLAAKVVIPTYTDKSKGLQSLLRDSLLKIKQYCDEDNGLCSRVKNTLDKLRILDETARGMKIDSRDAAKRLITEYEEEMREAEIEKQDCDLFLLWAKQNMKGNK